MVDAARPLPKPRMILSVRDPAVEELVREIADGADANAVRAFTKAVCRARNSWDIARRSRGGMFGRRIHRSDADRALRRALAALEQQEVGHHG